MFLIGGAAYGLEIRNVQQAEANFRVKNTFTKGRSFSETYREKQAQTSLLRQYVFCPPWSSFWTFCCLHISRVLSLFLLFVVPPGIAPWGLNKVFWVALRSWTELKGENKFLLRSSFLSVFCINSTCRRDVSSCSVSLVCFPLSTSHYDCLAPHSGLFSCSHAAAVSLSG